MTYEQRQAKIDEIDELGRVIDAAERRCVRAKSGVAYAAELISRDLAVYVGFEAAQPVAALRCAAPYLARRVADWRDLEADLADLHADYTAQVDKYMAECKAAS